jgi:hypothetical protein
MVRIASIAVAVMAVITGTSAAVAAVAPFKQACTFPYDVCGWTLTDGVRGKSLTYR